ncbi:MAG TPA: hypothetical protein VK929_13585 [Longimicrobiales bacterium]|nr:hypothetical protein [Longimicrobiales bacterium]
MSRFALLLLISSTALSACLSGGRPPAIGSPNELTYEDLVRSETRNAYEAVEKLRPRWLRPGPDRSLRLETVILVYMDGVVLGGIEALRTVPLEAIRRIHVLDAVEAGALPGLGSRHVERVIMLTGVNRP